MFTAKFILSLLTSLVIFAESMIGLRVLLMLLGALEQAPFVRWVYSTSDSLLYLFQGMFPPTSIPRAPFSIEFSAILVMFFYVFISYLLQEVITLVHIKKHSRTEDSR